MILFSPALGIMLSDCYGSEGTAELRKMAKRLRLDRTQVRSEGHPVEEHYLVPASKHAGMGGRQGVIIATTQAIAALRITKQQQCHANLQRPVPASISTPPPSRQLGRGDKARRLRMADAA
jgi:hypothetical protein